MELFFDRYNEIKMIITILVVINFIFQEKLSYRIALIILWLLIPSKEIAMFLLK